MKKYAQYLKEKYNRKLVESKNGFIDYEIFDDGSMYIHTLYVDPKGRDEKASEGQMLEEYIIQKENPWVVYCDIDKQSNRWQSVVKLFMRVKKYKIEKEDEYKVVMYKELRNE
jgi:hypothetical protein